MWLYVPNISRSSPEPGDSTWPSESLCRKLAVFATWRTKSLLPQSWRRALRKARWTMLLSGLTCDPSTVARGAARWMESLAVSLARISPSLASELESKGSAAACGQSSLELLGRFDRDGYSLRTSQVSLLTNQCEEFLETFPRSGSMRNGRVYERRMSEHRTSGSGCSSWSTAQAADSTKWWRTPSAGHPSKGGAQAPAKRLSGGHTLDLQDQVLTFSLPDQPIQPGGTCWCGRHGCDLRFHKRKLNPLFVAWLMGWPIWWCITEPMLYAHSEMESYLCRQRSRLRTLLDAGGTDEPRRMD